MTKMDEESKQLLKEELEVNKENNQLLHKLIGYQRWARWLGVIKWVVVIGTTLGALYYVQPMLTNLLGTYSELLDTVSDTSIKTLPRQN